MRNRANNAVLVLAFATFLILTGACSNADAESQAPPEPNPAAEAARTLENLCGFEAPLPEEGKALQPAVDACLERYKQMAEQRREDVEVRAASEQQLMSQSGLRAALHRDRIEWREARNNLEKLEAAIAELAKPASTEPPEGSASPPAGSDSGP